MTDTNPNTSLPLATSDGAGKPATGSSTPAKQPKSTAVKETIPTKAQPINPGWAEEIVAEIGIGGPMAKKVASDLAAKVAADFSRRYTKAKLIKLVRAALDNALD